MADKSDYGWKPVGEYLDNELADDDQDAKKMKKAKKEAQRKIAESRAAKDAKARLWFRNPRSPGDTFQTHHHHPALSLYPQETILPSPFFFLHGRSKRHRLISIFKWDGSKTRPAHALVAVNQVNGGMNVLCWRLPEYDKKERS